MRLGEGTSAALAMHLLEACRKDFMRDGDLRLAGYFRCD
jgi:hypothetical protein